MKKYILGVGLLMVLADVTNASPDYRELAQDLKIMQKILHTALKQKNEDKGIQYMAMNTTYLDGQGFLFELSLSDAKNTFKAEFTPPLPPAIPEEASLDVIGGDRKVLEVAIDSLAVEREIEKSLVDGQNELQQALREVLALKEQKRELEWERRHTDRKLRDLQRSLLHANDKKKAELSVSLNELKSKRETIESRLDEVNVECDRYKKAEKARMKKRKEKKKIDIERFISSFEKIISDMLCRYGNGLRSLPEDENINFRLQGIGGVTEKYDARKKDKMYIFSKKSVNKCVSEKITSREFINEAKTYVF